MNRALLRSPAFARDLRAWLKRRPAMAASIGVASPHNCGSFPSGGIITFAHERLLPVSKVHPKEKRFMRCFSFTLGLALAGATVAWAADKPPKGKPPNQPPASKADKKPAEEAAKDDDPSVAEQVSAVEKQKEIVKKYRETEDAAERRKLREEYDALQPDPEKYAKIVDKHYANPAVFPALQFLLNYPAHSDKALAFITKYHVDNPEVGSVCLQSVAVAVALRETEGAEKLIRAVIERSKSDDARGLAYLALGKLFSARADQQGVSDAKRAKLREEAKEALTTVTEKYADVDASGRNAGDWAKTILFEVEHLAIGLPVPDLAGHDLEGAEFKLSDYRGKVVFLDFWAHW